jgi:uncharacterized protein (DUF2461 family)
MLYFSWTGILKTCVKIFNGGGLYQGMHSFSNAMLKAYREAVDSDRQGEALINAIQKVQNAGDYKIGGSHYKRVPRGYDSSHRRAELLKNKGLYVISPKIDVQTLQKPDLVDVCFNHCKKMAPIHYWLVNLDQKFVQNA